MRDGRKYVIGMASTCETFIRSFMKLLRLAKKLWKYLESACFLSSREESDINWAPTSKIAPRIIFTQFILSILRYKIAVYCENRTEYTCQKTHYVFVTNITLLMYRQVSGVCYDPPTSHVPTPARFGRGFAVVHIVTSGWHKRKLCEAFLSLFRHVSPQYKSTPLGRFPCTFFRLISQHSVMELLRVSTVQCVWCVGSPDVDIGWTVETWSDGRTCLGNIKLSHAPRIVSVNDGPHIRQWSH